MCNYGKGSGNYSPSMGFANQSAMTLTIDLQKWIKVTKTNHLKVLYVKEESDWAKLKENILTKIYMRSIMTLTFDKETWFKATIFFTLRHSLDETCWTNM